MSEKQVSMIVVTGGPCAGKTSGLAYLSQKFTELGFKVIFVPEAATKLINAGIVPWELSQFQSLVFETILHEEKIANEAAWHHHAQKVLILCDRGLKDGLAYNEKDTLEVMRKLNISSTDILHRYQGVVHMVTAADGAEEFYTLENNQARKESKEQAKELDGKTANAWADHPHMKIIHNHGSNFSDKLFRTYAAVCNCLGIPEPVEIEEKYLVAEPTLDLFPVPYHLIDIWQVYLEDGSQVREWNFQGSSTYYKTTKKFISDKKRFEAEQIITREEFYRCIREEVSDAHTPIVKQRLCFVWDHQRFELDIFKKPIRRDLIPQGQSRLSFMELELISEQDTVVTPPFIRIFKNVTGDQEYSNQSVARIQSKTR